MKRIKAVLLLLFIATLAYPQGIEFSHITFEEACEKASAENKDIFIDVYTTWCGPCKKLSKEVFTQKQVGDYFNANFVSIKIDAENEANSGFFKLYKANAFPSLFWLSPNGDLLHTQTGLVTPEGLVQLAKKAKNSDFMQKARALEKRWNDGERSYSLISQYSNVLRVTDPKKIISVTENYVAGLSDEEKKTRETLVVLLPFLRGRANDPFPDNQLFKTFLENMDYYSSEWDPKNIQTGSLWNRMYISFVRGPKVLYVSAKAGQVSMDKYTASFDQLNSMDFSTKEMFVKCLKVEEQFADKKFNEGILSMKDVLSQYGKDYPFLYHQLLYSLAYSGYFLEGDKEQGELVLKFTEELLKVIPCKTSLMYYAVANNNLGNIKTAVSAMAWIGFYPMPTLSNAYYKYFGFENIRKLFPYQ